MFENMIVNSNECLNIFLDLRNTPLILPMLPYYSGILINMNRIKGSRAFAERDIFLGTLHQYIGALWNVILADDGNVKLISSPMIYVSFSDNKTWTDTLAELINVGLPQFYKSLSLPQKVQDDLIAYMRQRTSGWMTN